MQVNLGVRALQFQAGPGPGQWIQRAQPMFGLGIHIQFRRLQLHQLRLSLKGV